MKIAQESKHSVYLDVENLSVSYGSTKVLQKLNLKVAPGTIAAVMGPSGIGKTTLLKTISGLIPFNSGRIIVNGTDVSSLSKKDLHSHRINTGYMFQHGALFTHMSVFDNVAFPLLENTNLPASMIADLVTLKLNVVGLRGAKDLMPAELSGGMARRVALARASALDPALMLYDEPFTGQDPISVAVLVELIAKMRDALNLTSVIVSHDLSAVAKIADSIHIISEGSIIANGSVDEIFSSQNPLVKQFIKGFSDGDIPFHYPAPKTLIEEVTE
jgi:phospholipid/cholesterol/gamma-HCH transport system ATP-binding protein